MKNTINKLVVISLLSISLSNCNTGRHAYEGPKRSISELATIKTVKTENSKKLIGNHSETPNITHVDDFKVGGYMKGFPKKVFVLPGNRIIKTEYHSSKATKGGAGMVGAVFGGAVGGAIGASIDRARNADLIEKTKKATPVTVKAGEEYQLKTQSEDGEGRGLKVWMEGGN